MTLDEAEDCRSKGTAVKSTYVPYRSANTGKILQVDRHTDTVCVKWTGSNPPAWANVKYLEVYDEYIAAIHALANL